MPIDAFGWLRRHKRPVVPLSGQRPAGSPGLNTWRPQLEALEQRTLLDAGAWTALTHPLPNSASAGTMLLLTDGTVMVQSGGTSDWFQLTPTTTGSYADGTWSQLPSMNTPRLYYASNMLPSGNLFVEGGEFSQSSQEADINAGEIFDPVHKTWTTITSFPQSHFGDGPSQVLANGKVLAGYKLGPQTYLYDPATNTWSQAVIKLHNDSSSEETFLKLADGSVLTYNLNLGRSAVSGTAQRYIPAQNQWVDAGLVPIGLSTFGELGPAFLLPDGRAFFIGDNGNTALYTPATNSWVAGPVIPGRLASDDAPGAVLPNGLVLFAVDQPSVSTGPEELFLFDPTSNSLSQVTSTPPTLAGILNANRTFYTRMLMLPNGQLLYTPDASGTLWLYTPGGTPQSSWQPHIHSLTNKGNGTYTLSGTQLNGLDEGAAYGDDAEMSSNYPIIRLQDSSGNVFYTRTSNWSTTGVATGTTEETVDFTLPAGLDPGGSFTLFAVANGIASTGFDLASPHLGALLSSNMTVAGSPFTVTVSARNGLGSVPTGFRDTIHFGSSDPLAGLPADYTFSASDQGVHTFSVTLKTAGTQSIAITDTVTPSTISQTGITVNPAAASTFVVSGFPSAVTAGQTGTFTVTAKDTFGNTATGYTGTVHFVSSDPQAQAPANYTFTAFDAGKHVFSATLKTAGTQSLTAIDTMINSITGSQTGITVNPAAVSTLLVSGFPSPVTAGVAASFTITAKDTFGNTATGYAGTVHFTSSDGEAVLPANSTLTSGTGIFSLTLKTGGVHTLTGTDTLTPNLTGSQTGIGVNAAAASMFVVSGFPSPFPPGASTGFIVKAEDAFGNLTADYTGTVHFTSTDPQAVLPADAKLTVGSGVFTAALKTVGNQSITATDTVTPSISGTESGIDVVQTPITISGTVFQDVNINSVQDAGEPGIGGTMLFLDLDGSGALKHADPTFITDAHGNYQFTLANPGTYILREVLPPAQPPAIALGGLLLDSPRNNAWQLNVITGSVFTEINFANVPTSIAVPLTLPLTTPFPRQGSGKANADYVEALYRAILDRDADPAGLAFWTNQLNTGMLTRLQVVQGIRTSPEHFTQEVTDFYFTILNRPPDVTGLQSWVFQLQHGMLTEEEVAFKFLDSPEYLSKGDRFFVDHMYLSLLGRGFDSQGEAFWLNSLGDNSSGNHTHQATLTHEQVITAFLRSPESLNRLVQGYYQIFLQRLADPQGLNFWLSGLQQGQSFLTIGQDFLSSNEFYNNAAAEG